MSDMDCSLGDTRTIECCCKPKPAEGQAHSIACRVRHGDLRHLSTDRAANATGGES